MRIDSPNPQRPHGRGIVLLVCTLWIAALVSPGPANGQERGSAAGALLAGASVVGVGTVRRSRRCYVARIACTAPFNRQNRSHSHGWR
jgi:hypothetical protein